MVFNNGLQIVWGIGKTIGTSITEIILPHSFLITNYSAVTCGKDDNNLVHQIVVKTKTKTVLNVYYYQASWSIPFQYICVGY